MRSSALGGIFTSGRRPQGFSSTLLKVPNDGKPREVVIGGGGGGGGGWEHLEPCIDKTFMISLRVCRMNGSSALTPGFAHTLKVLESP